MTNKTRQIEEIGNEIPQSTIELTKIRQIVEKYVLKKKLTPPLQKDELIFHSKNIVSKYPEYYSYIKLLAVIINNYSWMPVVAQIPFEKRILLLPKCMRSTNACNAKFDALGLLCELCGSCNIGSFTTDAEILGYHTIVSAGTPPVTMLLKSGSVECIIGIACMESIEKSFQLAVDAAIPSIAIPLYNSDCKDSSVDNKWINEVIPVIDTDSSNKERINLEQIRNEIYEWFSLENINKLFGVNNKTAKIANQWLASGGKHWRPLIMVSIYKTIEKEKNISEDTLMKLAVAVECFHKASLVHDDIVDEDTERYKQKTLHEQHGIPIAINIGDLLTGYGYQMIAQSGANAKQIQKLLKIAAIGHRDLCFGQGQELLWQKTNDILNIPEILNIFSNKTSPAFEVALKFGAVLANSNNEILNTLTKYSNALGIAYQIKDDLEDFKIENNIKDINVLSPSLVTAILSENMKDKVKLLINNIESGDTNASEKLYELAKHEKAIEKTHNMLEKYQKEALDTLSEICNSSLKILLFRIVKKITVFNNNVVA